MSRKRIVLTLLAAPLALVALFFLAAWIGSSIPRNADWVEPEQGVEIFVGDNGIHTEIVMPLVTPQKDWRSDFPAGDLSDHSRPYTHVAVSWGEREVFLNTPTWSDLAPTTAMRAATGGAPLVHAAHYVDPLPLSHNRPLKLSEAQYARLVAAIETQLAAPDKRGKYAGYADHDVFYDAQGRYHLGKTCNQWTSDTLAQAGVRTGWWTPLPGGVMKWVESPVD